MSILKIFVPEAGLGESCDWAVHEADTVRSGSSLWAALPQANQIVLILAASRVLLTHVYLPAVNPAKLREILAFAVEDKLLTEPENVHTVAAPRAQNGETAVAIIDKVWLRQQIAHLHQYAIHAEQMLAETLLPRLENKAWSMVWKGQGGFIRIGLHAGFVVDGGDSHTPPMALISALDEARAANTAPACLLIYLTAGASAPFWSTALDIAIEQRGSWAWQSAETDAAATLNLLQGEFAPPRKSRTWTKQWRPAFAVLGLIAAVHFLATFGDWVRLRQEENRLQSAMVSTFKQTFPEAVAIVDPALQMRRNLSELQHSRGIADSSDFIPLLAQIAPRLHEGHIQTLRYAQDKLQLDLILKDSAQLESLREQLQTPALHTEIDTPSATPAGIKVHISLGMKLATQADTQ